MASDPHARFHAHWLGLIQPSEGLVLSIPVLVDAQLMERQPREIRDRARELAPELAPETTPAGPRRISDLPTFLEDILELTDQDIDADLPDDLALYVAEGQQTLRPTMALRAITPRDVPDDASPAIKAGADYAALVWDIDPTTQHTESGAALDLDRPEDTTGPWRYPPGAKFDRLLRACGVPIGLVTNREVIRLVYAPIGQSSGWIDFRLGDMLSTGGGPILDAFVALLRAERWFAVADDQTLPALLAQSRERQTDVTHTLAEQVFSALEALVDGFDRADTRDPQRLFSAALAAREGEDDPVYAGLLTVLLRLVVLLYAEAHGLMPVEHPLYAEQLGVIDLYDRLVDDAGAYPDEMDRRFGAWPRLLATFRAVYFGVEWRAGLDDSAPLRMPPRRGDLFDPDRYPWLEGRPTPGAHLKPTENAAVRTPAIDDGTVLAVLQRLIVLDGQRLSYKALDVEQIGSVYERLMGYRIQRLDGPAVCLKPTRVWMTAHAALAEKANQRARWLQDEAGLPRAASKRLARAIAHAIKAASEAPDESSAPSGDAMHAMVLDAIADEAGYRDRRKPQGALVLQPGSERRRTSSHYTPRSLSAPIVARTIEPLLATIEAASGAPPTAEQVLSLTLCDPAMGSGAFLVESCRFLADRVVAAWTRDGTAERLAATVSDLHLHARRLVAQRCLYGVDKNPFAVELARLSLWLITMARDLPFTFVDHALRWGDSLVGLSLDQIQSFHWAPKKQLTLISDVIRQTLEESVESRMQIQALAESPDTREKRRLLDDADRFTRQARLIADVCVGAFFAEAKKGAREKERKRRMALVERWLRDDPDDDEVLQIDLELRQMQAALRAEVPAFHWMLEFPEVFWAERPDPLAGGEQGVAWMDGFVGNPPFAGKNAISAENGPHYIDWLKALHEGSHGNADLSAHFFRRADALLGPHGTLGLIATNTIAQGDTRTTGIGWLASLERDEPRVIYDATESTQWPGEAAVTVSVVHMAVGTTQGWVEPLRLDGRIVDALNSRLRPIPERPAPMTQRANEDMVYVGAYVLGMGFVLTPEERTALVEQDPRNAEQTFPYLGGREVNSNPDQGFERYVINFGAMTLEQAERWPDLIDIVRRLVKPDRDRNNREAYRRYWWQFGEKRPAMIEAIRPLARCLVTARVSKHLMISFQPSDRVFSEQLYVFPLDTHAHFAVLQSRVHEPWAQLLSSSMKTDLRYSASDCFETFPFPPDMTAPALERAGEALYTARADYMIRHDQGLTATYNQLKDPDCLDPEVEHLRHLHALMDRAVLAAYGWDDIPVPPYGTADPDEQQAFEDEVIDRLFVLNAARAAEEQAAAKPRRGAKGKRSKGQPKDDQTLPLWGD